MAFSVSKFNKGSRYDFQIPKDFKFVSLHDLFNDNGKDFIYGVKGLYINRKSKYGDAPVVVTTNELVDLPKHLLDTVQEMRADKDVTDAINNDHVGFQIYTYEKDGRVCYSVNWVDC